MTRSCFLEMGSPKSTSYILYMLFPQNRGKMRHVDLFLLKMQQMNAVYILLFFD